MQYVFLNRPSIQRWNNNSATWLTCCGQTTIHTAMLMCTTPELVALEALYLAHVRIFEGCAHKSTWFGMVRVGYGNYSGGMQLYEEKHDIGKLYFSKISRDFDLKNIKLICWWNVKWTNLCWVTGKCLHANNSKFSMCILQKIKKIIIKPITEFHWIENTRHLTSEHFFPRSNHLNI